MRALHLLVVVALVALLGGAAGCIVQPSAAVCLSSSSCDTCIAQSGCGWCGATNRCEPGTSIEPASGACGSWFFASCATPSPPPPGNPCGRWHDCSSCAEDPTCGWCGPSSSCQARSGPTTMCTTRVLVDATTCGEATCNGYANCSECLTHAPCGWCDTGGGYCSLGGSCPSVYFYPGYSGVCAAPNNCSSHRTCGDCTTDPECGWCTYNAQCVVVGAPSCPDAVSTPGSC